MITDAKDFIIRVIASQKDRAEDTLSEFRIKAADGVSIKYLIEWGAATVEAEFILVLMTKMEAALENGVDLRELLADRMETLGDQLLCDMLNQGSTSALHNGVEAAVRKATSRAYRMIKEWVRELDRRIVEADSGGGCGGDSDRGQYWNLRPPGACGLDAVRGAGDRKFGLFA